MRPPSSPSEGEEGRAPHFVQSLERGLAVIRAFDEHHPELTLSDVARTDRADARGRAALPAHARRPRLRAHRRALVLAQPAHPRARLRLPVEPVAARGRRAAPRAAGRRGARVLLGVGARRRGHRLRRARADLADHDRVDQRRHALPGLRDVDGPRAARPLSTTRRSTPTLRGWSSVPLSPRTITSRRRAAGRARQGAPPGLGARRPGARGGPALGRRARSATARARRSPRSTCPRTPAG